MKVVSCQNAKLTVEEHPDPQPKRGQALLQVKRCGICGSDLHAQNHCGQYSHLMQKTGFNGFMSPEQSVVMGHEFCGEVLDYGAGSNRKIKPGTRVCAMPVLRHDASGSASNNVDLLGFSERSNGGYTEQLLVDEIAMLPIPNGLDDDRAALTEPMAVSLHAVNRAEIKAKDVAVVIGCGPVGLSIIACLKAKGVKTIIACDFSAARRHLALRCGADMAMDPAKESPYENWQQFGFKMGLGQNMEDGFAEVDKLAKSPLPMWLTMRLAEKLGVSKPPRPIVFECVGLPGVLNNITTEAPMYTRIIVVGVCMETDAIEPAVIHNKEIDLRFVFGYTPVEFRDTLHAMAEGKLDVSPLITGKVGLHGVENAFEALRSAELHAKILVDPSSTNIAP